MAWACLCYIHTEPVPFTTTDWCLLTQHAESRIIHCDLSTCSVLLKLKTISNQTINYLSTSSERVTPKPGSLKCIPLEALGEQYGPSVDLFSFGHLFVYVPTQSPIHPTNFTDCKRNVCNEVFGKTIKLYLLEKKQSPLDPLPPAYTDFRITVRTEIKRRVYFFEKAEQILSEELQLMKQCLHNRPAQRPHSGELVTSLTEILILSGNCGPPNSVGDLNYSVL